MKAAVLHEFKTPLSQEEVSRPEIAPDEVLIEVEVCGVCHSDLHVADGDWKQLTGIVKKPLILGHEIVGRVAQRGAAVDKSIEIGDRVGVPWVHWTCGKCAATEVTPPRPRNDQRSGMGVTAVHATTL